jgi:murein DD-endopeptidase MepM/ murein hydrolase activator NlpD
LAALGVVLLVLPLGCPQEAPPPPPPPATQTSTVTTTPTAGPSAEELLRRDGHRFLAATVRNSLEAAIVEQAGAEHGHALSQVVTRILVWWLHPGTDLRPGDRIEVVYQVRDGEEPLVSAVWFRSGKLGKDLEAVRHQPPGARYARWYTVDGHEVEQRLVGGPIEDYEQVTSLVGDGRRHKGVDFKAEIGTTVISPFDGVVVRKNWAMRSNGMSVDLRDSRSGNNAYFLHLSAIDPGIKVGGRVKKGQPIGLSGNTGRSTAPHLHYQLVRGNKILDPFRFHQTQRARLPDLEIPKLGEALARFGVLRTRHNDALGDL